MQAPAEAHWKMVKHILRYIPGILHYGLQFTQFTILILQHFVMLIGVQTLMTDDQLRGSVFILAQT